MSVTWNAINQEALAPDLDVAETAETAPLALRPQAADEDAPFAVQEPDNQTVPFVFCSPHSGRRYPPDFVAASRLDAVTLRRSEDSFVDELFEAVPRFGAPLLKAHFPRAFVDVNREPWELDPAMFAEPLPRWVNTRSLRVASGLGTIAKVVSDGTEIYGGKLAFAEAERRVRELYEPYHAQLQALIDRTLDRFGCAVLIDCHSMPSIGGPLDRDKGHNRADVVLGDRYSTTCSPILTHTAAEVLRGLGYRVARNSPYAGGYCTAHYGRPDRHVHALQIELNRALYMDETRMKRLPGFGHLAAHLTRLTERLTSLSPDIFQATR